MKYALGNMLNGAGGLNADGLALDLQFAADKTLTARKGPTPVLTRASTATFVGSNGLIQSAGNNVARFDHDPVTFASRGLLIEEGRTNLLLQSENFGTTWSSVNLNLTGTPPYLNVATAPDGATTADKLIATTSIVTHQFRQDVTLVSGTIYTISVYFKAAETNFATISVVGTASGGADWVAYFNVSASSPAAGAFNGFASTSLIDVGNGWRRCSVTFTASASGNLNTRFGGASGSTTGSNFYAGDGTSGFLIWGAQLEAGSFATSYIPTTTSTLARSGDICTITGSDFTSFYNQSEGTIVGSGLTNSPTTNAGPELFRSNDGTSNNRIQLGMTNFPAQAIRPFIVASGTTTYSSTQGTATVGVERKVGTAYKTNDTISAFNGTLGTLDTTVTPPTNCNQVSLFAGLGGGTISSLRYFKKRLANAKLQALTA